MGVGGWEKENFFLVSLARDTRPPGLGWPLGHPLRWVPSLGLLRSHVCYNNNKHLTRERNESLWVQVEHHNGLFCYSAKPVVGPPTGKGSFHIDTSSSARVDALSLGPRLRPAHGPSLLPPLGAAPTRGCGSPSAHGRPAQFCRNTGSTRDTLPSPNAILVISVFLGPRPSSLGSVRRPAPPRSAGGEAQIYHSCYFGGARAGGYRAR